MMATITQGNKMGVEAIVISVLSTLGTLLGSKAIWDYFQNRSDNSTLLIKDDKDHSQEMEKDQLRSLRTESTKSERLLEKSLDNLGSKLAKHEERITQLEIERIDFINKISVLERELEIERMKTDRLNKTLDTVHLILVDKGVEMSLLSLINGMR